MRDRLIELLAQCDRENEVLTCFNERPRKRQTAEIIADHLLANGVVCLPCKVGDKTFLLLEKISGGYDIIESKCMKIVDNGYGKDFSMFFDCVEIGNTLEFDVYDFGKTVFLTREEAERALKGEAE